MKKLPTVAAASKRRRRLLPVIIALPLVLWVGFAWLQEHRRPPPSGLSNVTLLQPPRPLGPFVLSAKDGRPFKLDSLRGHWTFLAIGYTRSPDVCPTTLATFDTIAKLTAGLEAPPVFVFVSVDPERDTLAGLDKYVSSFNPEIRGVTGTAAQLQRLVRQLGLVYGKVQATEGSREYMMDHSNSILLIDPAGRFTATFTVPYFPATMARDFATITNQRQ